MDIGAIWSVNWPCILEVHRLQFRNLPHSVGMVLYELVGVGDGIPDWRPSGKFFMEARC
jgi:hypothetical protein